MVNECNVSSVIIMRIVQDPRIEQGKQTHGITPSPTWTWEHHTGPNPHAQTAASRRCGLFQHGGGTACLRGKVVEQCPSCHTVSSPRWEEERSKLLARDS